LEHNPTHRALALVGPGRAGTALALALGRHGWSTRAVAGRTPEHPSTVTTAARLGAIAVAVEDAGRGCDLVVLATPDAAVADVAARVAPSLPPGALVVHLSGALGVDALAGLARRRPDVALGALHPLQSLPTPDAGAARLPGSWCAVEGPDEVRALAELVGMRPFTVGSGSRPTYHAAACVASNHLVALLGQVERLARDAGVPFEAFLPLVRASVENVDELGPAAALTGPVARGDASTVAAHLDALSDEERAAYRAGALAALRLAGRDDDLGLSAVLSGTPA
jgi:predicted short-subunit dehydrogenase-like oxidoreductase (DUF2520 family)